MYQMNCNVRFSECDKNQKLSCEGIVNYFQDCSNLHSESVGLGYDYLTANNRAWMLDFWQIIIKRRPGSFENIKVFTWPNGFKGFLGTRNFVMRDESDELLACANSYWVHLDTKHGRLVRVSEDVVSGYEVEPPFEMEYAERKLQVPDELTYLDKIKVMPHHLDVYQHMNNAKYIQIACDYAKDFADRAGNGNEVQICCQYKIQARLGDEMSIWCNESTDKKVIVLKNSEDAVFAVISFEIK